MRARSSFFFFFSTSERSFCCAATHALPANKPFSAVTGPSGRLRSPGGAPKTSSSVSHQPFLDTTFILGRTRFSRVGRRAPAASWAILSVRSQGRLHCRYQPSFTIYRNCCCRHSSSSSSSGMRNLDGWMMGWMMGWMDG